MADGDDVGFFYTGLIAVFADAKAGTDKAVAVTVTGKKLTNENYQLPASDSFVLKGTIEKTKQMEVQPELTLKEDGISMTLHRLSPIALIF